MRAAGALLILLVAVSGCFGDDAAPSAEPIAPQATAPEQPDAVVNESLAPPTTAAVEPERVPPVLDAILARGERHPSPTAFRWIGANLSSVEMPKPDDAVAEACWAGACVPTEDAACEGANCERVGFVVERGDAAMRLDVAIRWPSSPDIQFRLRVEDASGNVVARGINLYSGTAGLVAQLDDPEPGEYEAVIVDIYGASSYEGAAQLEPIPGAAEKRDLLPDLVTLPPTDLTLETPSWFGTGYVVFPVPGASAAAEATGARGCKLDEVAGGAKRCLRFSNSVGNVGEGPLEVRLPAADAAGGAFTQRIYSTDGSFRELPGGAAEFHAVHGHWHNAASNRFVVRAYDEATGAMGTDIGEGRKTGVCFADTGLIDIDLPLTRPATYTGYACIDPRAEQSWVMGISPNWYDAYPMILSDQFVDLGAAPDGAYALCSVTNAEGTLLESDLTNNEACALFRLKGNDIEMISADPYHKAPDGTYG